MSKSPRSFAVFDIDGTIIRWQLYHAVSDQLAKNGLIDAAAFEHVRRTRMNWKKRAGEDSFATYERELIKVFNRAIKGMKVSDFAQAADQAFEEYKDQVYTYTRDLIRELQAKNYLLFAISGSPSTIVAKLAKHYGFDDFAATNYPSLKGRFTGEEELSVGRKHQLLEQLIKAYGASRRGSIAVGDTEGDITMLEMVDRPIVFNPSKQLLAHATKAGWEIVIERKNVVYKLQAQDGSYILGS